MTRNMFSLTPRRRPSALPSSYSTPEAPPSPEMPSILRRISSSSWAIVFLAGFGDGALAEGVSGGGCGGGTALVESVLMLDDVRRMERSLVLMIWWVEDVLVE